MRGSYQNSKLLSEVVLNVELFYHIYESDIYTRTNFKSEYLEDRKGTVVQPCFEENSLLYLQPSGLKIFGENLQLLIDSMQRLELVALKNSEHENSIREALIENSLQLAHQQGLNAVEVKGYICKDNLQFSSWILVDYPDLGVLTIDPFTQWRGSNWGTIQDLFGYYLITESCFSDPMNGAWVAQVHKKRKGVNPVAKAVAGVDFMDFTYLKLVDYYNNQQLNEADNLATMLLALNPSNSKYLIFSAMIDARKGDYEKAKSKFGILLKNINLSISRKQEVYWAFGNFLAIQGKSKESVYYLCKSQEPTPYLKSTDILQDPDLIPLRNYPPFIDLVRKLEQAENQ